MNQIFGGNWIKDIEVFEVHRKCIVACSYTAKKKDYTDLEEEEEDDDADEEEEDKEEEEEIEDEAEEEEENASEEEDVRMSEKCETRKNVREKSRRGKEIIWITCYDVSDGGGSPGRPLEVIVYMMHPKAYLTPEPQQP
ncbi:hypothetical protein M8J76_004259 [Diaphorina citri]|nr:hypothetical protein M8J76_004259 [Diaphorina citri]